MSEPLEVHRAIMKVGISEDGRTAVLIVECNLCGRLEFPEIAVEHLMTVSNATAQAARMIGVEGEAVHLADVTGPEPDAANILNEKRRKAGWN